MRNETEMYRFETANFVIRAVIVPDDEYEADDAETRENLDSGLWQVFGTIVTVTCKANGHVLSEDSLWGSVYSDPSEFFTAHRDSDPMNRNCSAMRAARGGKVSICHYFPGMVSEAIHGAREAYADMPKLRNPA